jgi:hypothetical protein
MVFTYGWEDGRLGVAAGELDHQDRPGGPPIAVSRDSAAGPHHPSKPAGRLSRFPTSTPAAVSGHASTRAELQLLAEA